MIVVIVAVPVLAVPVVAVVIVVRVVDVPIVVVLLRIIGAVLARLAGALVVVVDVLEALPQPASTVATISATAIRNFMRALYPARRSGVDDGRMEKECRRIRPAA